MHYATFCHEDGADDKPRRRAPSQHPEVRPAFPADGNPAGSSWVVAVHGAPHYIALRPHGRMWHITLISHITLIPQVREFPGPRPAATSPRPRAHTQHHGVRPGVRAATSPAGSSWVVIIFTARCITTFRHAAIIAHYTNAKVPAGRKRRRPAEQTPRQNVI